jgi:hypothetical protein
VGKKYIMGGKEIYNKVGKKILMAPMKIMKMMKMMKILKRA